MLAGIELIPKTETTLISILEGLNICLSINHNWTSDKILFEILDILDKIPLSYKHRVNIIKTVKFICRSREKWNLIGPKSDKFLLISPRTQKEKWLEFLKSQGKLTDLILNDIIQPTIDPGKCPLGLLQQFQIYHNQLITCFTEEKINQIKTILKNQIRVMINI